MGNSEQLPSYRRTARGVACLSGCLGLLLTSSIVLLFHNAALAEQIKLTCTYTDGYDGNHFVRLKLSGDTFFIDTTAKTVEDFKVRSFSSKEIVLESDGLYERVEIDRRDGTIIAFRGEKALMGHCRASRLEKLF
jgi:hypothetical protein